MSERDSSTKAHQWPDIDSLDLSLFPHFDFSLDLLDNGEIFDPDQSLPGEEAQSKSLAAKGKRSRRRSGTHGADVKHHSRYRAYPIDESPIWQQLHRKYSIVTKDMLTQLIALSIRICPECARPIPPSRAQKRAKAGLVAWIDFNAPLCLRVSEQYLHCLNEPERCQL
jgi:hypothetical protein